MTKNEEVAREIEKFQQLLDGYDWFEGDWDGGDFQDKAIELGILVEVEPSQEFKEEWGDDAKCYNYYWRAAK